jgi:hypothetical protein
MPRTYARGADPGLDPGNEVKLKPFSKWRTGSKENLYNLGELMFPLFSPPSKTI